MPSSVGCPGRWLHGVRGRQHRSCPWDKMGEAGTGLGTDAIPVAQDLLSLGVGTSCASVSLCMGVWSKPWHAGPPCGAKLEH